MFYAARGRVVNSGRWERSRNAGAAMPGVGCGLERPFPKCLLEMRER